MAGTMYHTGSPYGAHDALSFGIFCITTLVHGGSRGVCLESKYSYINI